MTFARHPMLPAKLRHLEPALQLVGPRGMCFHRAVAFVLDVAPAELCFGTFRPASDEERARPGGHTLSSTWFVHAWCEWRGSVWAPSLIEKMGGLYPIDREMYLRIHDARDLRRLTRGQVKRLARQWGIDDHLKRFTPLHNGARFADVLLGAAGIPWRENADGGVEAVV